MNTEPIHKRIALLLQAISVFVAAAVFFGFLIVNIYLAFFGFWDFNFLKVEYVSAGTLFLLFLLVPAALAYLFSLIKARLEKFKLNNKNSLKSFLTSIGVFIVFVACVYLSLRAIEFPLIFSLFHIDNAAFLNFLGLFWVLLVFSLVWVINTSKGNVPIDHKGFSSLFVEVDYILKHFRFIYIPIVLLILVFMFTWIVYPFTPRYFGGGQMSVVTIALDHPLIGLEKETNPLLAFLIYQSSDSLLVVIDSGTYLLDRKDISAIKFLEANKYLEQIEKQMHPSIITGSSQ